MNAIDELWQLLPNLDSLRDHRVRQRFELYADWLVREAIPAGGLGPEETERVVDRHVLDALLFAVAAADTGHEAPTDVLDIGAGVGLPSIPLAIVWPHSRVVALDRAGRRCRLMRRAGRVLELANLDVIQRDVADIEERFELVTSRASLPPVDLRPHLQRVIAHDGVAIVAGSTESAVQHDGYVTRKYELKALDLTRWMLIMHPSDR